MTKTAAKRILDMWKNETNYFNGTLTSCEFEMMLQYRMGFSLAESITLTMALILAGAKFAD